jgi:hypothetical protein
MLSPETRLVLCPGLHWQLRRATVIKLVRFLMYLTIIMVMTATGRAKDTQYFPTC